MCQARPVPNYMRSTASSRGKVTQKYVQKETTNRRPRAIRKNNIAVPQAAVQAAEVIEIQQNEIVLPQHQPEQETLLLVETLEIPDVDTCSADNQMDPTPSISDTQSAQQAASSILKTFTETCGSSDDEIEQFFRMVKQPNKDYIQPSDFFPILEGMRSLFFKSLVCRTNRAQFESQLSQKHARTPDPIWYKFPTRCYFPMMRCSANCDRENFLFTRPTQHWSHYIARATSQLFGPSVQTRLSR